MDNEREIDIDLGRIFFMMRKRVVYIILATIICATLSGCITGFFITPKYTTSCSMYVYSNTDRVSTNSSVGSGELSASQQLVATYIVALKSDTVLEKVISELSLDISASQLSSMINCTQIDETEFFRVTVTSTSASQAADIANAIAKVAPDEIVRVLKVGGVEVLDYAKVPTKPSSPNLKKNILIGALVGFALSFAGFFVYEMFDTTITTEKDLEREFEIPILGSIPRLIPAPDKSEGAAGEQAPAEAANNKAKGGKK